LLRRAAVRTIPAGGHHLTGVRHRRAARRRPRWADRLLAGVPTRITPADVAGARLIRETVDVLLGISL
jgi:hypothetical protein